MSKTEADSLNVLLINNSRDQKLVQEKYIGQMEFWDSLNFTENNKLDS